MKIGEKITKEWVEEELHKIWKEREENSDRKIVIYTQSEEVVDLFHQMLKEEAKTFLDKLPKHK